MDNLYELLDSMDESIQEMRRDLDKGRRCGYVKDRRVTIKGFLNPKEIDKVDQDKCYHKWVCRVCGKMSCFCRHNNGGRDRLYCAHCRLEIGEQI